jgi:hypothetical protein
MSDPRTMRRNPTRRTGDNYESVSPAPLADHP